MRQAGSQDVEIRPHPAKFNDQILAAITEALGTHLPVKRDTWPLILDPFAGVGRIHELGEYGYNTVGVELECEWADQHPNTICGDSRHLTEILGGPDDFDAVVTSPAYGNRMADAYAGDAKGSRRHTYRIDLGRPLDANNGAGMHFGFDYKMLHTQVWKQCRQVLTPGGLMVVNMKNFIRAGEIVDVVGWHRRCLHTLGYTSTDEIEVPVTGVRHGQNHELRVDHEVLLVMRAPE